MKKPIKKKKERTVAFHRAKLPAMEMATLFDGHIYELKGNRRVESWKIKGRSGLCIRIFRKLEDGKFSKLVFGLTPDACLALMAAIGKHYPAYSKNEAC